MTVSRWDDAAAGRLDDDLARRIYTSRLLGADPGLVLHGGGNTSVKLRHTTLFGEEVDALVVKGSGADLADVDASGFAWLRLDTVARLARLDALTDTAMADALRLAALVAGGPAPSVEAILHALLPGRFVDHTHADAVVTVTNTPAGAELVAEVYGGRAMVVPYVMPGFLLAKRCGELIADGALEGGVEAVVLMNHGIFTWGETARESYERMIELVGLAEAFVARRRPRRAAVAAIPAADRVALAELRRAVSAAAGRPMVVRSRADPQVAGFLADPGLATISQRGTVTPDHVIRTKPWPLLGRDVDGFVARYHEYVARDRADRDLQPLDPAPRVVLDPELGLCCVGETALDAAVVEDIYRHTMQVILDAEALGGYRPALEADLFEVEYWDLEQAKLRRRPPARPFAGEVALVTGAAGGIGRACAAALLAEGAAVVGVDVDPAIERGHSGPAWLGVRADVTDAVAVEAALDAAVRAFGGLDVLVLNAGVFPATASIADLDGAAWRRVMAVNLDAQAALLKAAHPVLVRAAGPGRGRVVVVGSKNVPAPGPGVAAYSASKAALTQLARVAALEWGVDGIRVNVIHPDGVFDTAMWTDEVMAQRAAQYGLTVAEYRARNVLRTEVSSADVARMCVALCGPAFARTTGAQVPVDGGNDRVI